MLSRSRSAGGCPVFVFMILRLPLFTSDVSVDMSFLLCFGLTSTCKLSDAFSTHNNTALRVFARVKTIKRKPIPGFLALISLHTDLHASTFLDLPDNLEEDGGDIILSCYDRIIAKIC